MRNLKQWIPLVLGILVVTGASVAQHMVKASQGPGDANTIPWPVQGSSSGTPFQVRLRDGDGTGLADVFAVGDAISATAKSTVGLISDGTNYRAALGDTGGRLQINITDDTDVALVDGSGNLMINKGATTTTSPTKTTTPLIGNATACTAAGGASCTIIYASTDWISYPDLTITIKNTDDTDAIENVLVEWSPDNTSFEVWDSTTFANLAAGAIKSLAVSGNSRRFLRAEARSANDAGTDVWITASQD